jgi:DNA ligase-1
LRAVLLADLVATSDAVAGTPGRRRKVELLAGCLRRMDADEVAAGASYLSGTPRQERLDTGWATLAATAPPAAAEASLILGDVDRALEELARLHGPGSRAARQMLLARLFAAATAAEQRFLRGLLVGDLRQGALGGLAAQAIALAWDVPEADVRRALMLHGEKGAVATAAALGGGAALRAFRLTLFRPVGPMLARTATSVADAVRDLPRAAVEFKLDGARIQVHRDGELVRVYTRNLRDVTARSPEVVAVAAALPVATAVLDGEVIGLRSDARPQPFQDTMRRFSTEAAAARSAAGQALTPFFFDCLQLDGEDLLDRPLEERVAALERVVPAAHRVPGRVVGDGDGAEEVYAEALGQGHEGVMVKALDAPYEAGRRGASWRKVKPAHTLDLVVLAVEWGSGRRRGWLSNLHLGARDPATGGFVMLGKTFKGMTDEMLAWQTERLLELETGRDGHVVAVRPELVVEIAFDGVQASPRYPGGVALRFARVKRYRDDKTAVDADTIDTVRALR